MTRQNEVWGRDAILGKVGGGNAVLYLLSPARNSPGRTRGVERGTNGSFDEELRDLISVEPDLRSKPVRAVTPVGSNLELP